MINTKRYSKNTNRYGNAETRNWFRIPLQPQKLWISSCWRNGFFSMSAQIKNRIYIKPNIAAGSIYKEEGIKI